MRLPIIILKKVDKEGYVASIHGWWMMCVEAVRVPLKQIFISLLHIPNTQDKGKSSVLSYMFAVVLHQYTFTKCATFLHFPSSVSCTIIIITYIFVWRVFRKFMLGRVVNREQVYWFLSLTHLTSHSVAYTWLYDILMFVLVLCACGHAPFCGEQ